MKKLTLLLAALSVASAAYAKEVMPVAEVESTPMLAVTSVGQFIEVDNDSGSSDGNIGKVMLGNSVGLAYGDDWTFGLMARKDWITDTDDGMQSEGHRLELSAWKDMGDYSLGFKWRGEEDKDRFLLRTKYSYGMVSGWIDAGYEAYNEDGKNGVADQWYFEMMPVKVSYGPVTVGYYLEAGITAGSTSTDDLENWTNHQIRLYAPLYKADKLALSAEYRYQFRNNKEYDGDSKEWQENNRHIGILKAAYAMTDDLTIDGYYRYDFNKYDGHDGASDAKDDYYGEFCVGWTYKF
ncbi:hypothetical protein [Fusobacterium sp. MFO224]|uniref:hypothetical protein n=1 Tax=Fusobacterium sp. MFO224 TaxID=3378070 RepID=UPI003852410B